MKRISAVLLCLGLAGCATIQNPNLATTVDEAITYKTDAGKAMVVTLPPRIVPLAISNPEG